MFKLGYSGVKFFFWRGYLIKFDYKVGIDLVFFLGGKGFGSL